MELTPEFKQLLIIVLGGNFLVIVAWWLGYITAKERAARIAEHRHEIWKHGECDVDDDISACVDIARAIRKP